DASPYSNEASGTTLLPALRVLAAPPGGVIGGQAATVTVGLDGPAAAEGAVVTLASDNPAVASLPPSVTVPGLRASVDIAVTTRPVSTLTTVILTATYRGHTERAELRVLAPAPPPEPL